MGILAQVQSIRDLYPDHLVLLRVGDFFESFGKDARTIAAVLGLHYMKLPGLGDMCGVPVAKGRETAETLRDAGFAVILVEPVETAPAGVPVEKIVTRGGLVE